MLRIHMPILQVMEIIPSSNVPGTGHCARFVAHPENYGRPTIYLPKFLISTLQGRMVWTQQVP